jgi:Mg/Co/Ni transporter MgtE
MDPSFPYLLLTDRERRPIGWIARDRCPSSGPLSEDLAVPMSPLFNRRATLKDALSLLLDSDVQAGIVVDRRGATLGIVTADEIAEQMRTGEHVVAADPFPGDEPGMDAALARQDEASIVGAPG